MEDDPAGSAKPPVKECTAPRTTDLNIKQGNDPAGSAKPPVKECTAPRTSLIKIKYKMTLLGLEPRT